MSEIVQARRQVNLSEIAQKYYTEDQYLALEEKSDRKHEYYNGQIYQMSGGSARHGQITMNIGIVIGSALLNQPCIVYSSDVRIRVNETGLYTYPDTSVVCGEVKFVANRDDTITNPILLVEVLSKSTRDYDRGDKFEFYRAIPSLQYYLVVDQERPFVEFHSKSANGKWQLDTFTSLEEIITLPELGDLKLPLARIYNKVTFPARVPRRLRQENTPHPNPSE